MRTDCHLILVVLKMLDGIGCSGVEVKDRHHEFPRKMVGHNFRRTLTPYLHLVAGLLARSFDALLDQLVDVLDARNLRGLVWFRRLRVFAVAWTVGLVSPPTGFSAGGVVGAR